MTSTMGAAFNPFYGPQHTDPYATYARARRDELLAARLPGLRLTDGQELEWVVNPVHRGLRQLHLEWDA